MTDPTKHDGDCTIYASLVNGSPECGICTCGSGWKEVRKGNWDHMYSDELEEKMKQERIDICREERKCDDNGFDKLTKGTWLEIQCPYFYYGCPVVKNDQTKSS